MSTQGIFGVRVNGKDKLMYNNSDSYPGWLGVGMLRDIRALMENKEDFNTLALSLELVDESGVPTEEEIDKVAPSDHISPVTDRSWEDWYALTRHLQGRLLPTLQIGYGIYCEKFIADSLFCEWGYIVNLDEDKLEVYKGCQMKPHKKGRYAHLRSPQRIKQFYPCALIAEFPLDNLPSDEEFLKVVVGE